LIRSTSPPSFDSSKTAEQIESKQNTNRQSGKSQSIALYIVIKAERGNHRGTSKFPIRQ
jgi:hypothetical protein